MATKTTAKKSTITKKSTEATTEMINANESIEVETTKLGERVPDIDINQTLYVQYRKGGEYTADKVRYITIRESNVEIGLYSGRTINANTIGKTTLLEEPKK